jgi:vitamin B12 transporter
MSIFPPSPSAPVGVRVPAPVPPRSAARAATIAALALCLAAGGSASGQGPTPASRQPALDPVVVTASRTAQPLLELLADVTVIDADEIARAGVSSLAELLQRQPGVEIVQNGGPAAVSGVFLRGANRGQTLVLVDGLRVGSSSAGSTTLEAIPLDQIERIEVLRGPASSLYGADAIGGVIQVFTRRGGKDLSGSVGAGYGTYNTAAATAGIRGSAGPLAFAVQAGGTRSDGFNAIVDPRNFGYNDDRDGYESRNVSASLDLPWADGQSLAASYLRNRLNAQYDGGPGFDERTITVVETWRVASGNRLAPWWTSTLSAGDGVDDSRSQTAFGDFSFDTTQRQYTWQNDFTLPGEAGALTLGVERREERLATEAAFAVTARDTDAAFGVWRARLGDQALQANLRRDDSSQYGGRTTGAIAWGWRVSPNWRVTAGYGTAFKAPTFNDLYYPGFSNPDLVPETSANVEAAVYATATWDGVRVDARAIGYRNQVKRLIVFGCDADFNCRPENVDQATLEGVTLGLDATFTAGTTVTASLDLASPEDDRTGLLLPRRAREHGALAIAHPFGPVRVGLEFIASGRRFDDPANRIPLAGYGIVNLTAEWTVQRGITLFARADNVLDRDYELAAGYATGGARVYAGLRWQP